MSNVCLKVSSYCSRSATEEPPSLTNTTPGRDRTDLPCGVTSLRTDNAKEEEEEEDQEDPDKFYAFVVSQTRCSSIESTGRHHVSCTTPTSLSEAKLQHKGGMQLPERPGNMDVRFSYLVE